MPMWCTLVAPNCLNINVSLLFPLPILHMRKQVICSNGAEYCGRSCSCCCVCRWREYGREGSALQETFCFGQGMRVYVMMLGSTSGNECDLWLLVASDEWFFIFLGALLVASANWGPYSVRMVMETITTTKDYR